MTTDLLLIALVAITAIVLTVMIMRLKANADATALRYDNERLADEIARQQQSVTATQELIDRADEKLKHTFQSLAAEALHTNRSAFLDLARTSFEGFQKETRLQAEARQKALDSLVTPITDALRKVDLRLGEAEKERVEAYGRLAQQVATLGQTTSTLSNALRTPSVRGRWGEMQLRRVVEIAGMLRQCDFDEQHSVGTDARRLRPDMVVHLPAGKEIVVDAKAPLEAFLDAQETTNDDSRLTLLKTHARHVRDHMESLGSKAYWDQFEHSPEMVVLFLPGETLFSAALQHDVSLIEYGLARRVLLASPITLIAMLTTIAHAWRQEAIAENYREVAQLGKELHERLTNFVGHLDEVRRRLDGAVQAYNKAAGSFESRVLVSARQLKELNVTTAPALPAIEPIDTAPRTLKQAGLGDVADELAEPEP